MAEHGGGIFVVFIPPPWTLFIHESHTINHYRESNFAQTSTRRPVPSWTRSKATLPSWRGGRDWTTLTWMSGWTRTRGSRRSPSYSMRPPCETFIASIKTKSIHKYLGLETYVWLHQWYENWSLAVDCLGNGTWQIVKTENQTQIKTDSLSSWLCGHDNYITTFFTLVASLSKSFLLEPYQGPRDPIHLSNLTYSTTVLHSSDMVVVALDFTPVSHSIRYQSLRLASFLLLLLLQNTSGA